MEKVVKKKTLGSIVDSILVETLKGTLHDNGLEERERQSGMLPEDDGEESKSSTSKTMDSEMDKLKSGEVTTSDIVEKLNSIRAGRSFKSDDISKNLDEYVNSLTKAERVALLAFLKGLAQIVSGEVAADDATDPAETPSDVKMKKQMGVHTRTIKPNVIHSPEKPKTKSSGGAKEDTSGPVPITPKK